MFSYISALKKKPPELIDLRKKTTVLVSARPSPPATHVPSRREAKSPKTTDG